MLKLSFFWYFSTSEKKKTMPDIRPISSHWRVGRGSTAGGQRQYAGRWSCNVRLSEFHVTDLPTDGPSQPPIASLSQRLKIFPKRFITKNNAQYPLHRCLSCVTIEHNIHCVGGIPCPIKSIVKDIVIGQMQLTQ